MMGVFCPASLSFRFVHCSKVLAVNPKMSDACMLNTSPSNTLANKGQMVGSPCREPERHDACSTGFQRRLADFFLLAG
jgi:hypothetical protein